MTVGKNVAVGKNMSVGKNSSRPETVPSAVNRDRPQIAMFDTFWPKGPRPGGAGNTATAAAQASEPEPSLEPSPVDYPAPAETPAQPGLSVLKSGVVDGMAYTLYSDGSIEAELPQGVLRFGSITELRNHIEQNVS